MSSSNSVPKTTTSTTKQKRFMSPFRYQMILVAIISIMISLWYYSNPLLYTNYELLDRSVWKQSYDATIYYHIEQNNVLETILNEYQMYFLNDREFVSYKNHCLRVLSLAMYYYYHSSINNDNKNNSEAVVVVSKEQVQHDIDLMAMALAYHDLALWVTIDDDTSSSLSSNQKKRKTPRGTLDYLDPSVQLFLFDQRELLMKQKATTRDQGEGSSSTTTTTTTADDDDDDDDDVVPIISSELEQQMIIEMIIQHHKITSWRWTTKNTNTNNKDGDDVVDDEEQQNLSRRRRRIEGLVNAIRCSDWYDATMGILLPFGCYNYDTTTTSTTKTTTAIPTMIQYMDYLYGQLYEYDFHTTLLDLTSRIYPQSYIQRLSILRILKW